MINAWVNYIQIRYAMLNVTMAQLIIYNYPHEIWHFSTRELRGILHKYRQISVEFCFCTARKLGEAVESKYFLWLIKIDKDKIKGYLCNSSPALATAY